MRTFATIVMVAALAVVTACQPRPQQTTASTKSDTYVVSAAHQYALQGYVPQTLDAVNPDGRVSVVMEYLRPDGRKDVLGGVTAWQDETGTNFKIVVTRFTPGYKGFNLLAHGDCSPAIRGGFIGALPKTEANANGWIFMTLVAPEVRLADLRGRALVLRENNDNYKAAPPLGGAGGIASCGLVP
jgi:Cu/Zn superoxide dismutase